MRIYSSFCKDVCLTKKLSFLIIIFKCLYKSSNYIRSICSKMAIQFQHIYSRITVHGKGIEFYCSQMTSTRIIFRRAVINRRKIIILIMNCMGRNTMCHLSRSIIIQRWITGYHSSK